MGLSSELEGRGKGISVRGVGLFLWRRWRERKVDLFFCRSLLKKSNIFNE